MSPNKKKVPAKKIKAVVKKKSPAPLKKKNLKVPAPGKPKTPSFSPELKIYPTPTLLFEETAPQIMKAAREAVDARGRFVVALSGGNTPKVLFQQLTEEPYFSLMPWAKTFVFWVDERHVPFTDETSNYRMTQEFLLAKVPIPEENIFSMTDGKRPVAQAASAYEIKLGQFFGRGSLPRFDLALMGMGDDGHTASLFPGFPQVNERDHWVVGYYVDEPRKERVSLTFPVLNASRALWVMMEGQKKAVMVKEVLEGPSDPPRYPVQYLRPTDGKLIFAMDAAAASLLKKK